VQRQPLVKALKLEGKALMVESARSENAGMQIDEPSLIHEMIK
jgi:hypothetical protein